MRERKFVKMPKLGKLNLQQAMYVSRSCAKKKQYPNKNVAMAKARMARKRCGEEVEHYKCHFAGHWHIGHRKGSRPMATEQPNG